MRQRTRVLICPPRHYRVAYEINPWMHLRRQPEGLRAQRQWLELKTWLELLADPVIIEPLYGAPDMVFTANAGFVHRRRVVVSRFRHPQRRVEEPRFRDWFEAQGFEVLDWPQTLCFEGTGDALLQPDAGRIWFGHGIRSDVAALPRLQRCFDEEVIPLKLVMPSFYHLDTCLCPLPGGAVMYYPPALAAESRLRLYRLLPARLRIEVDREDAHAFACNALVLGSSVILNRASPALRRRLTAHGLDVIECDVSEFMRAGGAVKCLSLVLDTHRDV